MINPMNTILSAIFFVAAVALPVNSNASPDPARPALLPMPQSVQWGGKSVELDSVNVAVPPVGKDKLLGAHLLEGLRLLLHQNKIKIDKASKYGVRLELGKVEAPGHWTGQAWEAYRLVANDKEIRVTANTRAGLLHGVRTLRQLIVRQNGKTTVAACEIHDFPAFKIRGLMHDVGRNFQSLEQLKRQIDIMAAYKMNVFHFHLTEYHGWRLESKIFPNLQADSSFTRKPGKFYTQKEFVDLVDYCWARGITVIPEFDSPGHSDAFRKGVGVKTMRDPKAREAMVRLIGEICALVPKEKMPYFHVGTDEVRRAEEKTGADYLRALHKAVQDNGREVIGWWHGMHLRGDKRQILQTWATHRPLPGMRHIDSRSNYVNHLEALDFASRMYFQQPCRVPHGDEANLGGILCHWPDIKVDDEKLTLTNSPVVPAMVAYSEAVWHGVKKDRPEYWAKLPPAGTPEFKAYADFENRLAEQRDRFMAGVPFPFVETHQIEWRLLGPVADGEVPDLENGVIKDTYHANNDVYRWTKPLRGGAIHVKHFFGFPGHLKTFRKGKEVVWANTWIHSDRDREVGAWISFNTTSSSDNRAGVAKAGNWNANPLCNIWINGQRIDPPKWQNPGKSGKEFAFTNEIYTSRPPTTITLKKGWNKVLVKSAPHWKWVFSFSPVQEQAGSVREVDGLRYSATPER